MSWRIAGPSTYSVCFGVLGWHVQEGHADGLALDGLGAALVIRYDDEPGSPWTIALHVDERGAERQREGLSEILLGRLGGPQILRLPWVSTPSELEHGELRVGSAVRLRATRPVETEQPVACGIPGYDRRGTELYADELRVHDGPFESELRGNCAFATGFDYRSE